MDRRQRKSREAILKAFSELLSQKSINQITVAEIIERADVGRATFYAHFETKDYLLKELCEELFCHVFDQTSDDRHVHKHIFSGDSSESVFLHLLRHLQKNDNNILQLLTCQNNEVFLNYFKIGLNKLIESQLYLFENKNSSKLPKEFRINHISSSFVETVKWWINNGTELSPEKITEYFFLSIC